MIIREYEPLAPKTTLGVGGPARYYAEPECLEDQQKLLAQAQQPVFILGRGSNLIVADEGFPGWVVRLRGPFWEQCQLGPDGCLEAFAGLRLQGLAAQAAKLGLGGFAFLEGIPGSLGGALRMNAGAMGSWIYERVVSLTLLHWDGSLKTYPREALHVAYRCCQELQDGIALKAILRPQAQEDPQMIQAQIGRFAQCRRQSQPRLPSAGCIFKNPPGQSAGQIIDRLGLKGFTLGGAQVSDEHANFVVNKGGAKAQDVLRLIAQVHQAVYQETGIALALEVVLLGTELKL